MILKQLIPDGFCLSCQGCCRFLNKDSEWTPVVFYEEQSLIPNIGNKVNLSFDSKDNKYFCSFFDVKKNICSFYQQRPFDCQLYPFLLNLQNEELFLGVDFNCPFVEKNFSQQFFQDYVNYLKDLFKKSPLKEIIIKNKQLLQSYSGIKNIFKLDC